MQSHDRAMRGCPGARRLNRAFVSVLAITIFWCLVSWGVAMSRVIPQDTWFLVSLAGDLLVFGWAILTLVKAFRWSLRLTGESRCSNCEYKLVGLPLDSPRCPECGIQLFAMDDKLSSIQTPRERIEKFLMGIPLWVFVIYMITRFMWMSPSWESRLRSIVLGLSSLVITVPLGFLFLRWRRKKLAAQAGHPQATSEAAR
jgi:hypothetical protein